ncbi:HigA family addiction module antitoxin [Nonomuraea sp. CA-141351]|uniref:HigA family addiction module antitoxin n=1 Tax=Nonomuraea sp. CA-141351 TaxID=3239996 RepID=UPI003D929B96
MTLSAEPLEYAPESVDPPGETLKETLENLGITQADLARRIGLSTKHVNQIIQGAAILSPETAILLERATRVPASIWNNLEARWRTQQLREQESKALEESLPWLDNFPLGELEDRGVLPDKKKNVANLRRMLEFFGVANPKVAEELWGTYRVAFRRSTAKAPNEYATLVWLRLCVLAARDIECRPYTRDALLELLPLLRSLTVRQPSTWINELPGLCAQAGVAIVFQRSMPHTHLSGATRWLTPDKVMIALSDRYKKDDRFWFSLFHEIAHVLLHGKRLTFLDGDPATNPLQSAEEDEANRFAVDILIPQQYAADYEKLKANPKPFTKIEAFAAHVGLAEGIVVGRLQHDGALKYNEGHRFLKPVAFAK